MRKSVHLGSLGLMLLVATNEAQATLLFSSSFESPTVATGFASGTIPTGWNYFTNNGSFGVTHTASPLPSPAGGSQYLVLSGVNTGITAMTGALIRPNVVYTLSAAIGKPDNTFSDTWSIQLYTPGTSSLGTFIGQQWAAHQGANLPTIGGWATNTFSFNGNDVPTLQGAQIVILLNNYLSGQSAYDSITLSDNQPDPPAVPEPISSAIFGMGLLGLGLVRARRMPCPAL